MFVWTKFANGADRDSWEARLHSIEDASIVLSETVGRSNLRIDAYCTARKTAEALKAENGGRITVLKQQDWVAISGQPKSPPLKIRDRFVISEEVSAAALKKLRDEFPGRTVLSVPATMAFGTGHHATTSTCLRMLVDLADQLPEGKWRMLDLGAGTGVLAMAARVLGAKSAVGYDFDPITVEIARKNAISNGIDSITFSKKDITQWTPRGQVECIAANIFFDVLIEAFPNIHAALKPGGHLILSGILNTYADECLAAGEQAGIKMQRVVKRGKWVTALAQRPC
ncbi:MAG: 50S ribosomal protein L11 methyltransferase [Verrucomicrobiales bacterium]